MFMTTTLARGHRGYLPSHNCMGIAFLCRLVRHDADNVGLISYFYLQILEELYGRKVVLGCTLNFGELNRAPMICGAPMQKITQVLVTCC